MTMVNEVRNLLIERAKKVVLRHDSPAPNDDSEASDLRLGPLSNDLMRLYVAIMTMLGMLKDVSTVTAADAKEVETVRKYINGRDQKKVLFDILWGEVIRGLPQPALDKITSHKYRPVIRRDWQLALEPITRPAPAPVSAELQFRQQETACPGS